MQRAGKLIISLLLPLVVGGLGGLVTSRSVADWYQTLEKPYFSPPDWVFGPVWTLLYLLIGVSLYLVWASPLTYPYTKTAAYIFFGIQLVLNLMWSLVFFGLHAPAFAAVVILMLLVAIVLTMVSFWPISRWAALLLVPYLLWVSFATALNVAVALLN